MAKVFASRRFPDRVRAELERSFELDVHDSLWPPPRDELLVRVAGKDGLMLMLTDRVDDELLDAAGPQLRIVADYSVGIDNVDLEACRRRGVVVSNTPDVLTETTAELTIAILLALLRRVAEGDRLIRRRERWIWAPNLMLGRGLPGSSSAWSVTDESDRRSSGWPAATAWTSSTTPGQAAFPSTSCWQPQTSPPCTCRSPKRAGI